MTPGEEPGGLSALPVYTTGPSRNSGKWLESERFQGIKDALTQPPPGRRPSPRTQQAAARQPDSPMAARLPQAPLWKSPQALVLQYLLQVRIP